jgi:Tol biopolymer transport system component
MKCGIAIILAAASLCFAQAPASGTVQPAQASAPQTKQEPAVDAKSKAVAEAKTKRNAQIFEYSAVVLTLYDRSGKLAGTLGQRSLYSDTVFSPDRKRVAVVKADKADLENESADLWVLDVATGQSTRITTSAKTEFATSPVWSPDGSQLAYVSIRNGQEGIYRRASNGQGPEELLYKHTGAFLNLTDWSLDGDFLTFTKSDLSGGVLYVLPLNGQGEAHEIFRTGMQVAESRFSPDGRFVSYIVRDQSSFDRGEIFVRPVDPTAGVGPWQISDGSLGAAFWRRDGKEIYYLGPDRSVMVVESKTAPTFTFTKPKVLFRPPGAVPDRISTVSSDGERFLARPPARGPQLQQITIFDREGKAVEKVGEPAPYSQPSFSPDGRSLAVMKADLNSGRQDIWIMNVGTGKGTQLTNDSSLKFNPFWSPDGHDVLYISMRNGNWGVYRRTADGTGVEELLFEYTPGAIMVLTDITPDGKFLVCDSGGVIFTVPLTGSDPRSRKATEYLRGEFEYGFGRLSPDGRFMAFRSDEVQAERAEVYIKPFDASAGAAGDGDPKWRVSKDGALGMLAWRSDGKEIFFRGLDLDSNDLEVMAAEVNTAPTFSVGTPKLLFKLPGPLGGSLGNISRNGQRFVFAINVPASATESAEHVH